MKYIINGTCFICKRRYKKKVAEKYVLWEREANICDKCYNPYFFYMNFRKHLFKTILALIIVIILLITGFLVGKFLFNEPYDKEIWLLGCILYFVILNNIKMKEINE